MKKIFLLLLLFVSVKAFAQFPPPTGLSAFGSAQFFYKIAAGDTSVFAKASNGFWFPMGGKAGTILFTTNFQKPDSVVDLADTIKKAPWFFRAPQYLGATQLFQFRNTAQAMSGVGSVYTSQIGVDGLVSTIGIVRHSDMKTMGFKVDTPSVMEFVNDISGVAPKLHANYIQTDPLSLITRHTADSLVAAGGGGGNTIYTASDSLTSNRVVNTKFHSLSFQSTPKPSGNSSGISIDTAAAGVQTNNATTGHIAHLVTSVSGTTTNVYMEANNFGANTGIGVGYSAPLGVSISDGLGYGLFYGASSDYASGLADPGLSPLLILPKEANDLLYAAIGSGGTPLFGTGYVKMAGATPSYVATIPNADLVNSALVINGTAISLGASGTITAAAGTLTGTVLKSTVVTSSLTSVGTLVSGSIPYSLVTGGPSGTLTSITPGFGHTSSTPITTSGTITVDTATAIKSKAGFLTDYNNLKTLIAAKGTGSVTSVATGLGLSGGAITTTGTIIADTTVLKSKAGFLTDYNNLSGRITTNTSNIATNTSNISLKLTNPLTTTGDIIYSSSGSTAARLAIGGANTVLHGGTTPSYSAIVNGDITNSTIDLTTKVTGLLPDGNISSASTWNAKLSPSDTTTFGAGLVHINKVETVLGPKTFSLVVVAGVSAVGSNVATDGVFWNNATLATSGAPLQYSSIARFHGSLWNTTATAAPNYFDWKMGARGTSSGAPTTSFYISKSLTTTTTPSYSDLVTIDQAGNASFTGGVFSGGVTSTSGGSFTKNNITTLPTDGLSVLNAVAATVGVPNQYSALIRQQAEVWNTTATAANNWTDFASYVKTISGAVPTSALTWRSSLTTTATPSYTDRMSLDNSGNLTMLTGTVILKGFTVAGLPTGVTGMTAYVTDSAASPTFGSTATGGGSTVVKVFYNGSNWIYE